MAKTVDMPKPREEEIERMEEIKFFLFISKIKKIARGAGLEDELYLIRPLINITGCSENLIYAAVNGISTLAAKPHELEIAVTAKYMGYHYDFVEKNLMYASKYSKLLDEYVNNHELNFLTPKLIEELTQEIIKFNTEMKKKMTPIYMFLDGEFRYKERTTWDS